MSHDDELGPITHEQYVIEREAGHSEDVSIVLAQAQATLYHCKQKEIRKKTLAKLQHLLKTGDQVEMTPQGRCTLLQFVRSSRRGRASLWQKIVAGHSDILDT